MTLWRTFCIVTLLVCASTVVAQEAAQPASACSGNWCTWPTMTGDWCGVRTDLAEKGITLDIDVTQVFQHNMHGGRSTRSAAKYSGSTVLELKLDTGKMGLWPGGSFTFLADGVWGGGIDRKVGALLPTNLNAALPGSAEPGFGLNEGCRFLLSEFFYTQVLCECKLILLGGKLWGARAFDTNVFANNHREQFMNVALRNNVLIPQFLPYTTMGVGVIVNPTDWLSILTAVADSDGRAKTTGFETAFHGDTNTTVIHEWAFKVKPCNLPGNQRIGFIWSSKDFDRIDPMEPFDSTGELAINMLGMKNALNVLGLLASYKEAGDNIAIYYNFDQYLYTEADDPSQGIGLFGRFGWARQDVSPVCHFYSIGMGGKGVIPTRDNDTCGLGYYYADLSNQFPAMFHSEQGIELYYNIEICPWLHVSPDFQIIMNPGGTDDHDVSLVGGVRVNMKL
ncbi:MAG: carbohydrate porin [Planctomycetota bacterium]|nr:MAG: carbohydrate porin [Planctomycetota bacterium]